MDRDILARRLSSRIARATARDGRQSVTRPFANRQVAVASPDGRLVAGARSWARGRRCLPRRCPASPVVAVVPSRDSGYDPSGVASAPAGCGAARRSALRAA